MNETPVDTLSAINNGLYKGKSSKQSSNRMQRAFPKNENNRRNIMSYS